MNDRGLFFVRHILLLISLPENNLKQNTTSYFSEVVFIRVQDPAVAVFL